jgi:polyisoprenyl-phosphate glycosyltransferase
MKKLISIVIPVYFEEEVIEFTYIRVKEYLSGLPYRYEIVFVNDGSKDKSLEILKAIAKSDKTIKIISFSRNFGHQVAITAGIDEAAGDAIVVMDADLQDPPEVISEMLVKWEKGYDVVYAKRKQRNGESFFKKFTAQAFYRLLNKLTDIEIPLDTGDFRLMDKKIKYDLLKIREKNRFVRGIISWIGHNQTFVEYERPARFAGETKYPLRKMLKFALDGITSFSVYPLKIALSVGFFSIVIAFFLFIYAISSLAFFPSATLPGWTSTIITTVFFGGVQLFTIGIIGEYIGRIFEESKKRPLYLIDEKINFEVNEKLIPEESFELVD